MVEEEKSDREEVGGALLTLPLQTERTHSPCWPVSSWKALQRFISWSHSLTAPPSLLLQHGSTASDETVHKGRRSGHSYSRSLFSTGDDEAIPQGGVHGEDRPCVGSGHQPQQEVVPPHVHVAVDGTREGQVGLQRKSRKNHRIDYDSIQCDTVTSFRITMWEWEERRPVPPEG